VHVYRLVVHALRLEECVRAAAVAVTAAVIAALTPTVVAASGATQGTTLRLDGVPFAPELALTPGSRSLGLMNRKRAPADGMLFVFPGESRGGFWMKNTLVPLRILFFDAKGVRVRALRMTPCRTESCPIYDPGKAYHYALELRVTDRRPGKRLGPPRELGRLSRLAS
jgi:uncharacterized membrane protein (UPF0127 family)